MTRERKRIGREGEEAAAAFLQARGYSLRERNFHCPLGELDIVAEEGGEIVFVEVRTRSSSSMGTPQESVDRRKQHRLRRLAAYYLQQKGLGGRPCRFDVVAVWVDRRGEVQKIELVRGAF
ncbi:MAG: YraN family protein [Thermoanaerobacteraceae bacterium]|nr:YraN family protein [Thermoanaerobacteraceae bacterium]